MQASIQLGDLKDPQNVRKLETLLSELYDLFDPLYETSDPDGSIKAQRGKLCIFQNGSNYETKVNVDGDTTWKTTIGDKTRIRAYKSAAQTITKNTYEKVELDAETYDNLGEFASYKFTATVAGYYLVIGQVQMVMDDDAPLQVYIKKNGVYQGGVLVSGNGQQSASVSDILSLAVDDYVELWIYHNNAVNTAIGVGTTATFMCVHKLL